MNKVKSMRKAVVLCSAFAFFGLSMAAANADAADAGAIWSMDIVDELDALSQQGEQTNPWAASRGGTWGFYEGTASDLGEAWTYAKTDKDLVGFYDDSRRYCCFLANPSTSQKAGPSAINANIAGRKVLYHPKSASSVETLRYVAESAGTYSVSGTVRRLSTSGNGVTADVVVNGTTLVSVTSTTDVVTFVVTNGSVWAGGTIDLKLTANGIVTSDATELTYAIARIGDARVPIVQTASEILAAATHADPAVNPIVQLDGRPGTWGFYRRTSSGDALLTARLKEDNGVCGLAVTASANSFPQVLVNATRSALTPANATKSIDPGEMFLHPEYGNDPVVLRYTADIAGRYSFAVSGRDRGSGAGNGVNFVVWHVLSGGGDAVVLAQALLAPSETVSLSGSDVSLGVGESIELAVDANGANAYDATGLRFTVCLNEKIPGIVSFGSVPAMRANRAMANPVAVDYVDGLGGKWSYGYSDETTFAFTPFSTDKISDTFSGWSAATYLLLLVNANNVEAYCSGHGTVSGSELAVHPDSKKAATVRFSAPSDGLYGIYGHVRALNGSGGNGVEGRVVVRENGFATRGLASAKTSDEIPTRADLTVSGLWLKANDSVDLSLGPNGDFGYDASAMSWIVSRIGDLPTLPYVSFDICGTSRTPCAGAGRIGLASDGAWVPVGVGATKSKSGPLVGGVRRAVRLLLSKAAGSTALANVATVVSDGVVSAGADDPVAFTVTGLEPGAAYSFCAYSRNASGVCGVFEVGGETLTADETWFCHTGGDCCRFSATADADGEIAGVFRGTSDGAATFCALQVTGETFPEYEPQGMVLIFR